MKKLMVVAVALVAGSLVSPARADDKPNPVGSWKFSVGRADRVREMTIKLSLDGETLKGVSVGKDMKETPLEEVTWKDGQVGFQISRERNGQKMTTKFSGKLEGDTIKGKMESDRGGQPRDWEAKRAKD
jgi:hypothetical protein